MIHHAHGAACHDASVRKFWRPRGLRVAALRTLPRSATQVVVLSSALRQTRITIPHIIYTAAHTVFTVCAACLTTIHVSTSDWSHLGPRCSE
eukprot:3817472-Prymnesium_polylepis.1